MATRQAMSAKDFGGPPCGSKGICSFLGPFVSREEMKKHSSKGDAWVSLHHYVYDITSFMGNHPGGESIFLPLLGGDITEEYVRIMHSKGAIKFLRGLCVGVCLEERDELLNSLLDKLEHHKREVIHGSKCGQAEVLKNRSDGRLDSSVGDVLKGKALEKDYFEITPSLRREMRDIFGKVQLAEEVVAPLGYFGKVAKGTFDLKDLLTRSDSAVSVLKDICLDEATKSYCELLSSVSAANSFASKLGRTSNQSEELKGASNVRERTPDTASSEIASADSQVYNIFKDDLEAAEMGSTTQRLESGRSDGDLSDVSFETTDKDASVTSFEKSYSMLAAARLSAKKEESLLSSALSGELDLHTGGNAVPSVSHDLIDFKKPLLPQISKLTRDEYMVVTNEPYCTTEIIPIFPNFLEHFTLTYWYVIPLVYLPIISYLLFEATYRYSMQVPACMCLFIAGIFVWTLAEYLFHRFVFHYAEECLPDHYIFISLHFLIHAVHHMLPMDPLRLVMPPALFLILVAPFWALTSSIFPISICRALWAGIIFGYLSYDMIHYASHHRSFLHFMPYAQDMKVYHLKHHYRSPQKGFGVSNILWDVVFSTYIE